MALEIIPKDSKLRIKFKTGVDEEGNDILKTKTLSKIKSTAKDEDILAAAKDLSSLQLNEMVLLTRVDEKELTEID